MTKQTTKSTALDMQNLFDLNGFQDAFKTFTSMNERMLSIATEAGTRMTDVSSEASKEAFTNVRDLTKARNEPAEYGKAYTDFLQKQTELFTRTAQAFATDMQKVGGDTADLTSKAGEEITSNVTASAESAAQKVSSATGKAA